MRGSSVDLIGYFEREEANFLIGSFDHCHIEIIARSKKDTTIALLRWSPEVGDASTRVADRSRVPPAAYYVLAQSDGEFALTPLHSQSDLDNRFPGHFDKDAIPDSPSRNGCLLGALATFSLFTLMTAHRINARQRAAGQIAHSWRIEHR